MIGYLDATRMLVAWCELRNDFRNFRIDRVSAATVLDDRFPERPARLRARWLATLPKASDGPLAQGKVRAKRA